MRGNKPYTNVNFTKRVDREAGRHRTLRAPSEPAVCGGCGALYVNRRWAAANSKIGTKQQKEWRPPRATTCPACRQSRTGEPRGFVYLDGNFLSEHYQEIENLMRNEAARAAEVNPLARILDWKKGRRHKIIVTTTTEHLAQRLGHALEKAFAGDVHYDFSHENKLARVSWRRD